jgi:hypothetical protein
MGCEGFGAKRNEGPRGYRSVNALSGSAPLPFVISTGAQRSGEICGPAVLSWKCFSKERRVVEGVAVIRVLLQSLRPLRAASSIEGKLSHFARIYNVQRKIWKEERCSK